MSFFPTTMVPPDLPSPTPTPDYLADIPVSPGYHHIPSGIDGPLFAQRGEYVFVIDASQYNGNRMEKALQATKVTGLNLFWHSVRDRFGIALSADNITAEEVHFVRSRLCVLGFSIRAEYQEFLVESKAD